MIVKLRKKSQMTIPKEIIKSLNLQEGDHLEISLKDGMFTVEPVEIYSKNYQKRIEKILAQIKKNPDKYSVGPFGTIEDALAYLKADDDGPEASE